MSPRCVVRVIPIVILAATACGGPLRGARTMPDRGLVKALGAVGVDIDDAPDAVWSADDREFCGLDQLGQDPAVLTSAQRCLVDRALAEVGATYVSVRPSTEGDPLVSVYITGANGSVTVFTDSSRDRFGATSDWSREDASRFTFGSAGGTVSVSLDRSSPSELNAPLPAGTDDATPRWFSERVIPKWCGIADSYNQPIDADALRCLRDALHSGDPVEYVVRQSGDEGERGVLWYRVVEPGVVEVTRLDLPGAAPTDTNPPTWTRQRCAGIDVTSARDNASAFSVPVVDSTKCIDL